MADYADILNTSFAAEHGNGKSLGGSERMNLRYNMAKTMLSDDYSHLKSGLVEKADAEHEAALEEWSLTLQDISSAVDVSMYVFILFPGFVDSRTRLQCS